MNTRDPAAAEKVCSRCKQVRSLADYYADKRATDGRRPECKPCFLKLRAEYRATHPEQKKQTDAIYRARQSVEKKRQYGRNHYYKHQEAYAERRKQRRRLHPEKSYACNVVLNAIKRGRLVRPDKCQQCGATAAIEASHSDYRFPMKIQWLCVKCHRLLDKSLEHLARGREKARQATEGRKEK